MNCLHGFDARFCAACNRSNARKSSGASRVGLEEILLKRRGFSERSLGLLADYDQTEWHPALLSRGEIITSGRALLLRMTIRRG